MEKIIENYSKKCCEPFKELKKKSERKKSLFLSISSYAFFQLSVEKLGY